MLNKVGWGLLIGGGLLSLAEGVASADVATTGIPFEQSPVGAIEAKLPLINSTSLLPGTILLIAGASILWVWPFLLKKA